MSALQISRMLGLPYKTAWFMCHRIRESLREHMPEAGPLDAHNKVIEADETYAAGKAKNRPFAKPPPKEAVPALVERGGKVRSRHVPDVRAKTPREAIVTQADRASCLMTDEAPQYRKMGEKFAGHGLGNRSIDDSVRAYFWHANIVEGYFSILKRGVAGVYHNVSAAHLHRCLADFDFRYNEPAALSVSDAERMAKSVTGIVAEHLIYRRTDQRTNLQA